MLKLQITNLKRKFMQRKIRLMHSLSGCFAAALALGLLAGCKTEQASPTASAGAKTSAAPQAAAAPAAAPTAAVAATAKVPNSVKAPIRINAGMSTQFKDSEGNVWLPDQGFADGDTVERPADQQILNTKDPQIYRTEHWGMTAFSYPVPNGKYIVKLHFAETFDGVGGQGERVFSFKVNGQEFKDFDVWAKAGGPNRAYVQPVNVEVTDGKLDITFTPNLQSPEINGIEILPAP
jgi:hypothetical protein